jgi:hypothetical protein
MDIREITETQTPHIPATSSESTASQVKSGQVSPSQQGIPKLSRNYPETISLWRRWQ